MLQDTANEGYSTAHIAGNAVQVDKTLDVLHKMIESGKKAAEVRSVPKTLFPNDCCT